MDFNEFLTLMSRKVNEIDTDTEIREAYRIFDKDDNGNISKEDLCNVFNYIKLNFNLKLNDDEINEIINYADHDKDGLIDFQDFSFAMSKYEAK